MISLPAADDPAVSVIVLLDGAAAMAERCLHAIAAAHDPAIPCETVLFLNDPDDELASLVGERTSGARVILARANAGPAVGWNLAAELARAPRIATLHEDSEPDAGWLAPLCDAMSEHGAGAVGSRLYNRDGTVQNCGWVLFSDASHAQIDAAGAPEVLASREPTPADMLSGAAMLIDREALRAAGGWDERFHPAVFSDIDACLAIWRQGRLVLSVPSSSVRHTSGAFDARGNSALTGPRLRSFLFERHRDRFLAKWGAAVRELSPPAADHEPENARAAVRAALSRTRERAEQVRAAAWRPPGPPPAADRRFSGAAQLPVEDESGVHRLPAELEAALRASEQEVIHEYCRWLARSEKRAHDELADLHRSFGRREGEFAQLQAELADLRGSTERREREFAQLEAELASAREAARTLDLVLNGRWWRLRTAILGALRPLRAAVRRLRASPGA